MTQRYCIGAERFGGFGPGGERATGRVMDGRVGCADPGSGWGIQGQGVKPGSGSGARVGWIQGWGGWIQGWVDPGSGWVDPGLG